MSSNKDIDFVRLDILENWRFWNKYAKAQDFEGAGKEVIAQANALLAQDLESNSRAAKLISESIEFHAKKQEAGRKGGLAKARNLKAAENQQPNQPTNNNNQPTKPPKRKKPPTKEQVYEFAQDNSLDDVDARTWFEQNFVDRPGCDTSGETIRNWKGALISFCKKQKEKRGQK